MSSITSKMILETAKRELPQDLIFQDREYYQEPVSIWKETYNPKKRNVDLGRLISNINIILPNVSENDVKRKAILRYFVILIDTEKHRLNYRACRSHLIGRYKDLVDYI